VRLAVEGHHEQHGSRVDLVTVGAVELVVDLDQVPRLARAAQRPHHAVLGVVALRRLHRPDAIGDHDRLRLQQQPGEIVVDHHPRVGPRGSEQPHGDEHADEPARHLGECVSERAAVFGTFAGES
jgi:hypothetical protein